ncbi:MAG: alpha-N-arabinofuranosidase [Chloroflexota bacterium]
MRVCHGHVEPTDVIGPVSRRLFGSFVEHMGRAVYGGLYEPGHPTADAHGFRGDVLALVRELGVTVVRYPGGNFVSGYRWEDGVGPVGERPRRLDLAWHSTEPNAFGVDEFIAWARLADVEPMLAVNLGTRGIEAALGLLEYANHPSGTTLSDRRVANGSAEPHSIRLWCLGNEMDGPWQLGHLTAAEYGRKAAETARAMRMLDATLELVACGSSGPGMPTMGEWERTVLEQVWDQVDLLSLHLYHDPEALDLASCLAAGIELDRFIDQVASITAEVGAAVGGTRRIGLSLDEWNVWYMADFQRRSETRDPQRWPVAPPLAEDRYTAADAVTLGALLISILRHADRLDVACLAQLVNVIAPIATETGGPAWRQSTFHPFALAARLARGVALRLDLDGPTMETSRHGDVRVMDAVATSDPVDGSLAILAVARDPDAPVALDLDLRAYPGHRVVEAHVVHHPDPAARNAADAPDVVAARPLEGVTLRDGRLVVPLPPIAWAAILLRPTRG